jgi:hypothetical protein
MWLTLDIDPLEMGALDIVPPDILEFDIGVPVIVPLEIATLDIVPPVTEILVPSNGILIIPSSSVDGLDPSFVIRFLVIL